MSIRRKPVVHWDYPGDGLAMCDTRRRKSGPRKRKALVTMEPSLVTCKACVAMLRNQ